MLMERRRSSCACCTAASCASWRGASLAKECAGAWLSSCCVLLAEGNDVGVWLARCCASLAGEDAGACCCVLGGVHC